PAGTPGPGRARGVLAEAGGVRGRGALRRPPSCRPCRLRGPGPRAKAPLVRSHVTLSSERDGMLGSCCARRVLARAGSVRERGALRWPPSCRPWPAIVQSRVVRLKCSARPLEWSGHRPDRQGRKPLHTATPGQHPPGRVGFREPGRTGSHLTLNSKWNGGGRGVGGAVRRAADRGRGRGGPGREGSETSSPLKPPPPTAGLPAAGPVRFFPSVSTVTVTPHCSTGTPGPGRPGQTGAVLGSRCAERGRPPLAAELQALAGRSPIA
ncbi:bcl-2-binding component 3, isoforms 3/4-like, partial [Muntiacus reevesi]|uniref:bcl-2-binding component 3, isoforms 3/4-like n=1 Tax=Muntiacus reevesi TaxID=9886 RepID=UPI003306A828